MEGGGGPDATELRHHHHRHNYISQKSCERLQFDELIFKKNVKEEKQQELFEKVENGGGGGGRGGEEDGGGGGGTDVGIVSGQPTCIAGITHDRRCIRMSNNVDNTWSSHLLEEKFKENRGRRRRRGRRRLWSDTEAIKLGTMSESEVNQDWQEESDGVVEEEDDENLEIIPKKTRRIDKDSCTRGIRQITDMAVGTLLLSVVLLVTPALCNQDAVHITAILGESVVFNCHVEFPGEHPVPYVLQWEKKVGDTVRYRTINLSALYP